MKGRQKNSLKDHSHWAEKTNHTRLKHLILQSYLKEWARILANASHSKGIEDIYYIDGFAGRGFFLDGDLGSPLIAVEEMLIVQKKHNEEYPEKPLRFHVINIEMEESNYRKLEEIKHESAKIVDIQNIFGNFKNESKKILSLPKFRKPPCFWFVDPFYGARDFSFDDVISLLFENEKPRYRKEILINFMTFNIVRFINHEVEQPFILQFLGASSIDEIRKEATLKESKLEEVILNFYKNKLREKGLYVITQRIQCKDPKNHDADKIYFHMIHCSHNERALIEMRNSFVKVKEKKYEFEKELEGNIIDFFDLGLLNQSELGFSHNSLISLISEKYAIKEVVSFKSLMTYLLQEAPVSFEVLKDMLHDLWKQNVVQVLNLGGRKKPFHVKYQEWEDFEATLVKMKYNKPDDTQQQLSLF